MTERQWYAEVVQIFENATAQYYTEVVQLDQSLTSPPPPPGVVGTVFRSPVIRGPLKVYG